MTVLAQPWVTLALQALIAASPASAGIRLDLDHSGPLILGETKSVPVTITAPQTGNEDDRPLRVSVNVGQFDALNQIAPDTFQTTYHLPTEKFPQVALVAIWRETGPSAPIEFIRIPLFGRTRLPVTTKPGADVTVAVGDQTFGPVRANRKGRAKILIAVPPGVEEVLVRSTKSKLERTAKVKVQVPPYNRLTVAISPYQIPADGVSSVTAHVYYDTSANPPPLSDIQLAVPHGTVEPLGSERNRYRFKYIPARGVKDTEVRVAVAVKGDPISAGRVSLLLGAPEPERLIIKSAPREMIADGQSTGRIVVLLLDHLGLGVERRALSVDVSYASVARINDDGNGQYSVFLRAPDSYPTSGRFAVRVGLPEAPALSGQLEVLAKPGPWPTTAQVSTDPAVPVSTGEESFLLNIVAQDQTGALFRGAELAVNAIGGRASEVKELEAGRYRAVVIPERGARQIEIRVSDRSGHLELRRQIDLRSPEPLLSLGARVGGIFDSSLVPTYGVELELRPRVGARRLAFLGRVEYSASSVEVSRPLSPTLETNLDAQLTRLPVVLAATYDMIASQGWRLYGGGAVEVVGFAHRITSDHQGPETRRWLGLGADALVGLSLWGFFVEVQGRVLPVSDQTLSASALSVGAAAGFRLGLLH